MGVIADQIARAETRARELPFAAALASARAELPPGEIAPAKVLADRRAFLHDTIADPALAEQMFERIIAGNELQDVAYLERGYRASRAVCRIRIGGAGRSYATGFLIAPGLLITNHHVFPASAVAAASSAEFDFEVDLAGDGKPVSRFALDPADFFFASDALDFAVVKLGRVLGGPEADPAVFGTLPLIALVGKAAEGEWLTIIQHPGGERKQVCVRENRFIGRTPDVLWYTSDTLGGSSGSPVFNNDWQVVALHHSGKPERDAEGRVLKIDGSVFVEGVDSDAAIRWVANEGIRVSRIIETLRAARADDPALAPVFAVQPGAPPLLSISATRPKESTMPERTIRVAITIDDDGRARFAQLDGGGEGAIDLDRFTRGALREDAPRFDAPFDFDYVGRAGFDTEFLGTGDDRVALPVLSDALTLDAAPLVVPIGDNRNVLHYKGMSIVMHAKRRWAIYSAANVDFANRFALSRPRDSWRLDPRISNEHQVGEFYYARNQFDRGHLTRREDMEFGATRVAALQQAADTLHFTNATPQHARFNQSTQLWQGLERHLLEDSIAREDFRAQVFTGPILDEGDPVYARAPQIQYPVRFWKVAVAKTSAGKLFAAAFMLDQSEVIAKYGIEATDVPFGPFKTFQVKVAEIERLTGLTFVSGRDGDVPLRDFDPLKDGGPRRPAPRGGGGFEATGSADAPQGYIELGDLAGVVRADD